MKTFMLIVGMLLINGCGSGAKGSVRNYCTYPIPAPTGYTCGIVTPPNAEPGITYFQDYRQADPTCVQVHDGWNAVPITCPLVPGPGAPATS